MPTAGYKPITSEQFGGLCTLIEASNLPSFMSPDCSDVEFIPGLVKTRPGTVQQFPANLTANWNYLKTYITPQDLVRMIAFDSAGIFWAEQAFGTLTQIGNPTAVLNAFANSVSLFGSEFIAIYDQQFGISMPRQLSILSDTQNFTDRVSQGGPGAAPMVADENASVGIVASPSGLATFNAETIGSISQSGFTVTFNTTTGGAIGTYSQIGDVVTIAGYSGAATAYNGTWALSAILGPQSYQFIATTTGLPTVAGVGNASFGLTQITTSANFTLVATQLVSIAGATNASYNGQYAVRFGGTATTNFFLYSASVVTLAPSGGGTLSLAGSIISGKHMVSVIFVTREGYLTQPAPPSFWVAGGSKRAVCTGIALGPANVTQRILCFTAVNADSFFYTGAGSPLYSGSMIINDNTTTSAIVDFTDALLLEGVNVDDLFDLVELGECSSVTSYHNRLIWSGERNKLEQNAAGFNNLGFDGGFVIATGCPMGWTQGTNFAGGGQGTNPYWGNSYGITGNGSAKIGEIYQTAVQDWTGTPIIQTQTGYSVRALISLDPTNTPTQGTVHIVLSSVSGAFSNGLAVTVGQLMTKYAEFIGVLTTGLTSIPSDLVFSIYADGTPSNGKAFNIDSVEVFPTANPNNLTIVRASRTPDAQGLYGPNSYNGVDGFQDVGAADGFPVRCSFVRRDFLYHVKERGVWVTSDDPNNEFSQWPLNNVSKTIGTPSTRGVAQGPDFDVVAGQDGLWLFQNGVFSNTPLSDEIRPTWDSINWTLGYLLDVKVDPKRKRVYIACPLGPTATKNNTILTLDYTQGWVNPLDNNGAGRQWVPWSIPCNSMNLIQRQNDIWQLFFGNNSNNGLITGLDLSGTVFTDNAVSQSSPNSGVKINDYRQSGYFQAPGRMDFGYLTANVVGSGMLQPILRKGDQGWVTQIRPWTMSALNFFDLERQLPANMETNRMAVRFNSVGLGDHFSLQSMALWVKQSAYASVRGINK